MLFIIQPEFANSCLEKVINFVLCFSPTVEEVTNGASETATEEVAAAATTTENGNSENGTTTTTEATNGSETKEAEAAPEKTEEKPAEATTTEESKTEEATTEGDEATKRKADAPSEDETVEKIAKLKETAAEVVSEAEKKLPEEPLTEAEATA